MSDDNGLEPGWLDMEIDRTNQEMRNRAIAETWTRMIIEFELRNDSPQIIPTGEFMYAHVRQSEPQDNRCMDTVARSMTNEARHLDVRHVEDIPFGEYGFSFRNEEVRIIVSCRTIEGDERLVHVVWGGSSCLGIITIRHNRLTVRCRYQDASIALRDLKVISQQSSTPPQPTSHVRRVEL